ncbi:helix-turn-helix domain-containing protein [Candidatus Saccharibacteria bacterium]|nr:helix-turn-helix domain-containing protein [Candidatus Saccharibacteria bacterium]
MAEEKKAENKSIALFGEQGIRREWDAEGEKWWFSVIDVVGVLTDQPNARGATLYWSKLKQRLKEEGDELLTNCQQLKMLAVDGKMRLTDVADQIQLLRIIQSIPSKKAEPFKRWLAEVGSERLDQMADPEKSIHQALHDYKQLGYSDSWIDQRLKSIEIRKDLTDSWADHGVAGSQFASLTDIIYKTWAGKTAKEYKEYKGLKRENLRDNMTNGELLMNMLAEYSTTSITNAKNPQIYNENVDCAREGGNIAKIAREQLEAKTGKKVVSESNASEIRLERLPEGENEDSIAKKERPPEGETEEETAKYKNNIAMLRRMRGLTQVYMAEKLGVARQTYINIEKGLKELTLSQVRILEDELQVTFEDLLGTGTDDERSTYRKYLG